MKILIVGAGIGGLALAGFLKQKDVDCEIVEKMPNFERSGFSIGMWANGRRMLKLLGVLEDFDKMGKPLDSFYLANGRGALLKVLEFSFLPENCRPYYTHIRRKKLLSLLKSASKNVPLRMGIKPTSIEQNEFSVIVKFSDGSQGEYALVVGADGRKSEVREMVFGKKFLHYENWRAYFLWTSKKFSLKKSVLELIDRDEFSAVFDENQSKALAVFYLPIRHNNKETYSETRQRLFKHFGSHAPKLQEILSAAKSTDVHPTDLADVTLKQWHKGRVVLLGDAAHAMGPFAGIGGSMAMEDAYVLAQKFLKIKVETQTQY